LLALEALGAIAGLSALPAPLGAVYHPRRAHTARYRVEAARQEALYRRLIAAEDSPDVPAWDESNPH
jgi:hypothetical protein